MTCPGTTASGKPCTRPALPSGHCDRHCPALAAERGRKGGAARAEKLHARREVQAQALTLKTLETLREALDEAARMAFAAGDAGTLVRAVSVGLEAIKTLDLQRQIDELNAKLASRAAPAGWVTQ